MHRPWAWLLAGLVLTTVCVVAVTKPIFDGPQLEADDYRYLARVQPGAPAEGLLRGSTIVNRWDHLWWIEERAAMRFFRPVVIASFFLDGSADPARLLVTNVVLHLLCTWLVLWLLLRLLGEPLPALLGSVLFAVMACHAEALWYVTGRNATLLALFVLGSLALHARGRRWWALLPFVLALGTQEAAAVLPVLCVAYDRWGRGAVVPWRELLRRWQPPCAQAAILALWWGLRHAAVGSVGSGMTYPYLFDPREPGFAAHLAAQFLTYGQNLAAGTPTAPFLLFADARLEPTGAVLLAVIPAAIAVLVFRDPRLRFLLVFGIATWLPTSFVYVSERYIYLPSVAFAGAVALALARLVALLRRRLTATLAEVVAVLLALCLIALQADRLVEKHRFVSGPRSSEALAARIVAALPAPPPGKPLYFLLFPGDWADAQFLEYHLRVVYGRPDLQARVLTPQQESMFDAGAEDERTLLVRGDPTLLRRTGDLLPRVDFTPGRRYAGPGFTVETVAGSAAACDALRFRFDHPLRDAVFVAFEPPRQALPRPAWIRAGRFLVQ